MSKDQGETRQIAVEEADDEEERPPCDGNRHNERNDGDTTRLDAKDSRAFWLACGCVAVLGVFGLIDAICPRDIMEDSEMLDDVIEVIKYVVTTSIGFFFATTVSKKE